MKKKFELVNKKEEKIGIIDLRRLIRESGIDCTCSLDDRLTVGAILIRSLINDITALGLLDMDSAEQLDYIVNNYFEKQLLMKESL